MAEGLFLFTNFLLQITMSGIRSGALYNARGSIRGIKKKKKGSWLNVLVIKFTWYTITMIPALELIRPACNVVTPCWQLVGPVRAVSFAVAHPAFVYAREIVVTVEVFVLVAMAWSFAVRILKRFRKSFTLRRPFLYAGRFVIFCTLGGSLRFCDVDTQRIRRWKLTEANTVSRVC